ncbi:MAG: hypothetical protein JRI22_21010 [Deltaproteobacteria bacterium]|nr:hypothetical protein [Deltaproteobacteria bacterium]
MGGFRHRCARWIIKHPYLCAIILSINVALLLLHTVSSLGGCASRGTGRTVMDKEWGYMVSRGGWSPNPKEVERIYLEEAARLQIEKPPKPYLLFMNVDRGLTFTSIPPLIIIEPCREWREVLRHELHHLFLWVKTGDGKFHARH